MKRGRQVLYAVLLATGVVVAIELCCYVVFFHTESPGPLGIVHYLRQARREIDRRPIRAKVGIWQRDSRLGYAHRPNARGSHRTQNHVVTYTIGPQGERAIPAPDQSRGRALFLGGSMTFGQGVADGEAYPYVLATEHWRDWTVVNKAVIGWGTAHSYLVLADELGRGTPPSMVLYAVIPHHLRRNYIRRSWVKGLAGNDVGHPHFELIGGDPVFVGVIDAPEEAVPDTEVRPMEIELTQAFLRAMQRACEEAGAALVVVLLPGMTDDAWPPSVIRTLYESEVDVIDLSQMKLEGFATDRHPNRDDHRRIAAAIASSPATRRILRSE